MNLSKNEKAIIELYRKNIFLKSTIFKLQKLLKSKSYQRIYESVISLEKANILKIEKIGKSSLVTLARTDESAITLAYLDEKESISAKIPNIKNLLKIQEIADDILIITGGYAKNKQTSKSDIDLAVITKENAFKKSKFMENATLSFFPPIHTSVFTYKDFKEMLINKEHNFGKELFKYHYILKNARRYYEILFEAIENGFNI